MFFLSSACKVVETWFALCIMLSMGVVNIRDTKGKLYSLKGALFVELCDSDGNLVAVMSLEDKGMTKVKVAYPGDVEFARYKRIFAKQEGALLAVNTSWQERKKAKWQE